MNNKLGFLKDLKMLLTQNKKRNRFLTMEEKRQLALNGEDVPICVAGDKKVKKYNVLIHKYIPNKNEDKRLNLK